MHIIDHDSYLAELVASEEAKLWITPGRSRVLRVLSSVGLLLYFSGMWFLSLSRISQDLKVLVVVGSIGGITLFLVCAIAFVIMVLHDRRVVPDLNKHRSGLEGERMLPKYLAPLDDRFYLINHVKLAGMIDEDIDHILMGPPGIFVIETKNHRGYVSCEGDSWEYTKISGGGWTRDGHIKSPSLQAKGNARRLREYLKKKHGNSPWVEAVVAFTHPEAEIDASNPTVAVLHGREVSEYVQSFKAQRVLSDEMIQNVVTTLKPSRKSLVMRRMLARMD
jgi:hypothetical protein